MNPALKKYSDAALIAELEARTLDALKQTVTHASDIDISRYVAWQTQCRAASQKLLSAIEAAGLRP